MVQYSCEICCKVFTQKSHYITHKNKKRPCKNDSTIELLIDKKIKEAISKLPVATEIKNEVVTQIESLSQLNIVKPFLKWVGGKTQILETVLSDFPKNIINYYEPFLGGGSVLLGVLSYIKAGKLNISGKIYASDLNKNLIWLYKNIQCHSTELISEIKKIILEYNTIKGTIVNRKPQNLDEALTSQESYYYWIRSKFNVLTDNERTTPLASALLLFMNKTCFRGVYREGPNGFNVPFGNYKNPSVIDEEHIKRVSELIKDVTFSVCSFEDSLKNVNKDDFIYLDPPYAPESDTSFVSYTVDGFNLDSHKLLFKQCNEMNSKGIKFLLSNSDVKLVKESFPSPYFKTKIISCKRAINSKNPESRVNEVLIMN
jgi:DNA adenine methylase